ncbi:maleylpyruvate isomerase N-terminal domain-containing protein [Terrabacter sp. NPDC080008]|uniref:maleylpyruvate isomerase N-terminal domain-containing protein n=1 Tax=Terrabacter sp. NPDC080008 TaxID=3155176 RepID=UPI003450897F
MATAERTDLADLLAGLNPAQWLVESLCEGWRVRDVVAHVIASMWACWTCSAAPSRPGSPTSTRWVSTSSPLWIQSSCSTG